MAGFGLIAWIYWFAVVKKSNAPVDEEAGYSAQAKYKIAVFNSWLKTPITFYGKVVDDKGKPLEDAKIALFALDHLDNMNSTGSKYELKSDAGGLFSIRGIHGMALNVTASKAGYYPLPESAGNFGYVPQTLGGNVKPPHPDSSDPAIFVLRKMGMSEPLVHQKKDVTISKTGDAVPMDLRTGKTYGLSNPDILVQSWTLDQGIAPGTYKHYDWVCLITVPGGGLQARKGGEFDFEAPADGYQTYDKLEMSSAADPWESRQSREYFLKLANGEYARMSFSMYAGGYNFFSIDSYLNPTPGHRNLEYDASMKLPAR